MNNKELQNFIIEELTAIFNDTFSDPDFWIAKVEAGEITEDQMDTVINEIIPYSEVMVTFP